jgi:Holliday junction resolvase RusA-like endonuclease
MKTKITKLQKIIIDENVLKKYKKYYFEKYPGRRTFPLDKPFPPSLNKFIAMRRMAQNNLKQKYKEFAIWLASYYNIANLNIEKAIFKYTFFFPDRRRRDFDNLLLSPKFFNDGFVLAGVLVDDNGERLKLEFLPFEYDKDNPRLEIVLAREEI